MFLTVPSLGSVLVLEGEVSVCQSQSFVVHKIDTTNEKESSALTEYYIDCLLQINACLKDIMSSPPSAVTSSTPVSKAISLLLQPNTKLIMIISSRTIYSPNKADDVGERALGFLTREATFSTCHALPFGPSSRGPKRKG